MMRKGSTFWLFVAAQVALLAILSWVSSYPWPSLRESNWDIVLFLTPIGILRNHLAESASAIRSFYGDPARGQGGVSAAGAWTIAIVIVFLAVNFVLMLRRRGREG